jgi:hypothetical protein
VLSLPDMNTRLKSNKINTCKKVKTGQLRKKWVYLLIYYSIGWLIWIYCTTYAAVNGNEQADRLAGGASIQGELIFDISDLLMYYRDVSTERRCWHVKMIHTSSD